MRRLVLVLLVLLLVSWFGAAQQTKTQGHTTSARARGKVLFQQHCASCHADDGKGLGPGVSGPDRRETGRSGKAHQRSG
jgi:mono/diheme cytochrome c family protein